MPNIHADEQYRSAALTLANAVQQALLPQECSRCAGTSVAAKYRPAEHVGGDFYDFAHLGTDHIGLLIGDVVGHGIHSALLMALLLGHLRANRPERLRPAQIVDEVNRLLVELSETTGEILLCSLFCGILDIPSRVLFYIDAGHPPPLCCRGRNIIPLVSTAALLGTEQSHFHEHCHQFEPGDRFVLFTDGIVETRTPDGQLFSVNRLKQALKDQSELSPQQTIDHIFAAVDSFSREDDPEDDATLVVLDFA